MVDFRNRVGSEQNGIRPAVVLQNDKGNKHSPTTIVAPITTKTHSNHLPVHIPVAVEEDSIAMLEQIVTIDKRRVVQVLGSLTKQEMMEIDEAILISLGVAV